MKKIIALVLSIICVALLLSTVNIRVAKGEITGTMYFEEGDYTNATLTTTDGEAWVVENYVAPLGDKVLIVYDRCDKDTIYDDAIIYIMHFTEIQ